MPTSLWGPDPGKLTSWQSSNGSITSAAFCLLVTEILEDVRELS